MRRTPRNKEYAEKPVAYPKSFSAYSLIGDPLWPFALKAFRKVDAAAIGHFGRLSDRVDGKLVNWLAAGLVPDGADAGAVGADVVGFQGLGVDDTYSVQLVGGVAGLAA